MNPFEMMKNLQEMQKNMQETQDRLASIIVQGFAGGDLVKIGMNGQMEVLTIQIDPSCLNPAEVEVLQDLIISAHTDALRKVRVKINEETAKLLPKMPGLA